MIDIILIVLSCVCFCAFLIDIFINLKAPKIGKIRIEKFEDLDKPLLYLEISEPNLDIIKRKKRVQFNVVDLTSQK